MEKLALITPSFWQGRRVLVTGHTGFKGSWLLILLQTLGAEVWGFSLPPLGNSLLFNDIKFSKSISSLNHFEGDILDFQSLRNFVKQSRAEVVIHLAAQALVRQSYFDPLGTWSTNVQGSLNLLEALRFLEHPVAVVMVTTDKVYQNREWFYGYRETDALGGDDPYSASKAAAEIAISSWRSSYCSKESNLSSHLRIATARSGNVVGGGDWSCDRIVPDAIRAFLSGSILKVRNPSSTRPWQHVLEPLNGYLKLAEHLITSSSPCCEAFNFGPALESNRSVVQLLEEIQKYCPGEWIYESESLGLHEASLLHLQIDKAHHYLDWHPHWDFETTVKRTLAWYKSVNEGESALDCCLDDLKVFYETQAD